MHSWVMKFSSRQSCNLYGRPYEEIELKHSTRIERKVIERECHGLTIESEQQQQKNYTIIVGKALSYINLNDIVRFMLFFEVYVWFIINGSWVFRFSIYFPRFYLPRIISAPSAVPFYRNYNFPILMHSR